MTKYAKALWAFASTLVAALTVAVSQATPHTLAGVDTLGWLTVVASVLGVTGGVYGLTNKS